MQSLDTTESVDSLSVIDIVAGACIEEVVGPLLASTHLVTLLSGDVYPAVSETDFQKTSAEPLGRRPGKVGH